MKTISDLIDDRRAERRRDIEGEVAFILLLAALIAFAGWIGVKVIANTAATIHQIEQMQGLDR